MVTLETRYPLRWQSGVLCAGQGLNFIQIPHEGAFTGGTDSTGAADFSGTLLHEIAHWTGAEHRLNRQFGVWGSENTDREGKFALTWPTVFYVASWASRPTRTLMQPISVALCGDSKSDKFEIFRAMKDASRIAEFVMEGLCWSPWMRPPPRQQLRPPSVATPLLHQRSKPSWPSSQNERRAVVQSLGAPLPPLQCPGCDDNVKLY